MSAIAEALGGRVPGAAELYPALVDPPPRALAPEGRLVLLVVDGLGQALLERVPEATTLRAHSRASLTSVFPSTTASAITTCMTGTAPQQHAQTGWFTWYRELGLVATPLPFTARTGTESLARAGVEPEQIFGAPPFAAALPVTSHVVQPRHLADSEYTRAHAGPAKRWGFRDLPELVRRVQRILRDPGPAFVYAYWPELDALAHRFGAGSPEVRRHLGEIDAAVAALARGLRGRGATVLLTADHGFVDTTPETRIELGDHPELADCLLLPLCGEPRVAYCYLRQGHRTRFEDYVRSELAHACEPVASAALVDQGWFGHGDEDPRLRSRVGDVTLLMKGTHAIRDRLPGESRTHVHVGVHGGASPEEMEVPLVMLRP